MEFKMAEEVKSNFSSEQAPPVKSELELVQERIANYTVPLKPNTANVVNAMLVMQLEKGMVKASDLEAFITVRDDITTGLADYQQQVTNANARMQQLVEQDQQVKMQQLAEQEQARQQKEAEERQRRKKAEGRVAQMEAVLLSHGISMDLNGDGVIGVKEGTLGQDGFVQLTAQEQQQVDTIVKAQTPLATPQQKQQRKGNMGLARAMNPVEVDAPSIVEPTIPLDTPQSHTVVPSPVATQSLKEKVLQGPEDVALTHEPSVADLETAPTVVTEDITDMDEDSWDEPIISQGDDLESFFDEVDKVEEELEGTYTEPTPLFNVAEEDTETQPIATNGNIKAVVSEPQNIEAPISTDEDFNERIEETKQSFEEWVESTPTVEEVESPTKVIPTYDSEEELLAAAQAKIDQQVQDDIDEEQFNDSFEDETEEVTIPDRTDLESMSREAILEQASMFEFNIPSSVSKGQMIDMFESETEAFIKRLQDSGEFVSSEESEDVKDDVRDGGYFG
jgi:hypothetical protein